MCRIAGFSILIFVLLIFILVNGTHVPDANCIEGRNHVGGKRPDIQV
jgi:hypothetical protein